MVKKPEIFPPKNHENQAKSNDFLLFSRGSDLTTPNVRL